MSLAAAVGALVLSASSASMAGAAVKRRILCLHGKGEFGASFLTTFAELRQACGPAFEWEAMDAPHEVSGGRAWWLLPPGERSFTAEAYEGDELSLEAIDAKWHQGSFDGVMGFSQVRLAWTVGGSTVDVRRIRPLPNPAISTDESQWSELCTYHPPLIYRAPCWLQSSSRAQPWSRKIPR